MTKKGSNPVDAYVGARVRMRRIMLGLSQEKLGDALGLTFQQVQKYEKGANRIGASRLVAIAATLKATPAFFFEGCPGTETNAVTNGASEVTEFFSLPYASELARYYAALDHNLDRRVVADVARSLAKRTEVRAEAAE